MRRSRYAGGFYDVSPAPMVARFIPSYFPVRPFFLTSPVRRVGLTFGILYARDELPRNSLFLHPSGGVAIFSHHALQHAGCLGGALCWIGWAIKFEGRNR
jgi:hypothetical protein